MPQVVCLDGAGLPPTISIDAGLVPPRLRVCATEVVYDPDGRCDRRAAIPSDVQPTPELLRRFDHCRQGRPVPPRAGSSGGGGPHVEEGLARSIGSRRSERGEDLVADEVVEGPVSVRHNRPSPDEPAAPVSSTADRAFRRVSETATRSPRPTSPELGSAAPRGRPTFAWIPGRSTCGSRYGPWPVPSVGGSAARWTLG